MIPDRWLRVDVLLSGRAESGLFVELLVESGARSVVEDTSVLTTYFPEVEDPERFVAGLARQFGAVAADAAHLSWSWQPHEAWSELWKQGLAARVIGKRLMIAPTWIDVEVDSERELLRIDPGVAFGTAEHATTRGCLAHLDQMVGGDESVLDLGSGSGILAIAALRLGARDAVAVEMDGMACATAAENADLNGVGARVRILERTLPPDAPFELGVFDIVIANMVVGLLTPRLGGMVGALAVSGTLVVGGIQIEERDSFVLIATTADLRIESEAVEEGWWSARLRHASGDSTPAT